MAVVIVPLLEGACFNNTIVLEQCQLSLRNRYFQAYVQIAAWVACGQGTPRSPTVCKAHGRAVRKITPVPCAAPSRGRWLLPATQSGCHRPWVPRDWGIPVGEPGWSPSSAASAPWWSHCFQHTRSGHAEGSGARGTPPAWGEPTSHWDTLFAALAAAPRRFHLSVARGRGARGPGGVHATVCLAASLTVTVRLIIAEQRKGIKCSH